ncbi:MAG: helix-turn-helix transcriptional regulator, partial [Clostridia bacterium]|nr:helix-turn-helix transcriptional regulator [Clostridia bacterium]
MKCYYRSFDTNLPIPMRLSFNVTNGNGFAEAIHTNKKITNGTSIAKYGFSSKLNFLEIYYCIKGEFNYVTDVGNFEIKEGECFLIGKQRIRSCDKNETRPHYVYTVGFEPEFCKSLGIDNTLTGIIPVTDIVPKNCIIDMIKEIDTELPGWENRATDIAKSLLLHVNEAYKDYAYGLNYKNLISDKDIKKIDSYINAHMNEKIAFEELANLVGLKSTQFNKRFKITTNCTPVEYINIRRCRAAREFILTTDFSLEEIIAMCGYNDMSYFYKKYKEVYGTNAYDDVKTS